MTTGLLDLCDELTVKICEGLSMSREYSGEIISGVEQLRRVNRRIRNIAESLYWKHLYLGLRGACSQFQMHVLSLNPTLWTHVRHLHLLLMTTMGGERTLIVPTTALGTNIRSFHIDLSSIDSDADFRIPISLTDALRALPLQSLTLYSAGRGRRTFEDASFNVNSLPALKMLGVGTSGSGALVRQMLGTDIPTILREVIAAYVDIDVAREVLLWSLAKVSRLELSRSERAGHFWSQQLLTSLAQGFARSVGTSPSVSLTSLSLVGFDDFLDESRMAPLTTLTNVFDLFTSLGLTSLSILQYGSLHWTPTLSSAVQVTTLTELTLDSPHASDCGVNLRDARKSLHLFLASFPNLRVLELRNWAWAYNLDHFASSNDIEIAIDTPCLFALLALVGSTTVHRLRIREWDRSQSGMDDTVVECTKFGDGWTRETYLYRWTDNGFMHLNPISQGMQHHRNVSFGIVLRPEFTGKGYGTEAMTWLLEQAFKRFNIHRVGGGTWGFNAPARAMYAKLGFIEEGVLKEKWWMEGEWQDEICLGMLAPAWKEKQQT
ncbi:hypothetical protein P7C70_g3178, partial [Phenoliferia sp. Uapishka_3]